MQQLFQNTLTVTTSVYYDIFKKILSDIKITTSNLDQCVIFLIKEHTDVVDDSKEYHNFINYFMKIINNKEMSITELVLIIITLRVKNKLLLDQNFINDYHLTKKETTCIKVIKEFIATSSISTILKCFSNVLKQDHGIIKMILEDINSSQIKKHNPIVNTDYPGDSVLTIVGLKLKYWNAKYNYEHPVFARIYWRVAVSDCYTEVGYWEWVYKAIQTDI